MTYIFCLIIAIVSFFGYKIIKKIMEKEEEKEEKVLTLEKQEIYNQVWNKSWEKDNKSIDIRNIPQLSFEQWLTFYNSSPSNWDVESHHMDIGGAYKIDYVNIFPLYTKKKISINTFWETPEDLWKYIQWQKNDYIKGQAAIFEQQRAHQLSKLANCLKEDIAERIAQTKKELDALEKETIANMPQKAPEEQLHNFLNFQRQVKNGDFDKTKLKKICDERIMLNDGSIQCKETYFYMDSTILSKPIKIEHLYIYNIKKENPKKEYIIHEEWDII